MRLGFLLLFIAVPLVELALLIKIGQEIGFWPTIAIVILTAVIGTTVLRRQGLQTMHRLNQSMTRGEPPVEPVIDGVFLLIAGGFLLTPGILTDAVGFAFLIPPVRRHVAKWGLKRLLKSGSVNITTFSASMGPDDRDHDGVHRPQQPRHNDDGPIIDGDFERIDDKKPRNRR